jgi:hypothetical protein
MVNTTTQTPDGREKSLPDHMHGIDTSGSYHNEAFRAKVAKVAQEYAEQATKIEAVESAEPAQITVWLPQRVVAAMPSAPITYENIVVESDGGLDLKGVTFQLDKPEPKPPLA